MGFGNLTAGDVRSAQHTFSQQPAEAQGHPKGLEGRPAAGPALPPLRQHGARQERNCKTWGSSAPPRGRQPRGAPSVTPRELLGVWGQEGRLVPGPSVLASLPGCVAQWRRQVSPLLPTFQSQPSGPGLPALGSTKVGTTPAEASKATTCKTQRLHTDNPQQGPGHRFVPKGTLFKWIWVHKSHLFLFGVEGEGLRGLEVWQAHPSETRAQRLSPGSPLHQGWGYRKSPTAAADFKPIIEAESPTPPLFFLASQRPSDAPPCAEPIEAILVRRHGQLPASAGHGEAVSLADQAFPGTLCQAGCSDCVPLPKWYRDTATQPGRSRTWNPQRWGDCQGRWCPSIWAEAVGDLQQTLA